MTKVKIVRSWIVKKKKNYVEHIFKIGQDIRGNFFAHCNTCNKSMSVFKHYDIKKNSADYTFYCDECKM